MAVEIHKLIKEEADAKAAAGKLLVVPDEVEAAREEWKALADLYLYAQNQKTKWGSSYTAMKEQAKRIMREKSKEWGERQLRRDPGINAAWIANRLQALMILRDSLAKLEEFEKSKSTSKV